ncbi:MAG TPA: VOC family protein [Nitrososphaerales archaeon]|nr:VOC family protein [Nitrososphaerales archaeon]
MVSKEFSVAVVVSDGKKSAKWFEDNLGFKSRISGHWVLVWPEGSGTKLHLCEGEPDPGNTGIAFYAKDAAAIAQKLKASGVKMAREFKKTNWGTNGMFADPDGNEYYLIEGTGPG